MKGKAARFYQALYDGATVLNSSFEPQEVLTILAESVCKAMDAKACSLMLLNPDSGRIYHSASYGLSDWYIRKGPVIIDQTVDETLKGHPTVIMDAVNDERVQYGPQNVKEGIASILSVPMNLKGKVIGVSRIYTAMQHDFKKDEIDFAKAMTHLGAIALDNARRYQSMKNNYDSICQDVLQWYGSGQKPVEVFKF